MPELWIGDLEVGEVRETTAVAVMAVGGVRRNCEGQRNTWWGFMFFGGS